MKLSKGVKVTLLVVLLVVIDQVIKLLVKTNMQIGESIRVFGDWFQILFIENRGMAFGMQFGGDIGKLLLTIFRLALVCLVIWYIHHLNKRQNTPVGVVVGLSLILAGAIGNVIDCMFYGLIFDYAPLMFGKVVDMLYFPLIDTYLPAWFPIWGGRHFIFFQPIFNFADSCVTCGTIYLILFQWKFFSTPKESNK